MVEGKKNHLSLLMFTVMFNKNDRLQEICLTKSHQKKSYKITNSSIAIVSQLSNVTSLTFEAKMSLKALTEINRNPPCSFLR